MRRREFITLISSAAAAFWPLPARPQRTRMLHLGIVAVTPRAGPLWAAFEQRLSELGYLNGQNLAIEFIQVNLQDDTIRAALTKLLSGNVDVIVTGGNEFVAKAALEATKVIPIVIAAIDYDPVGLGYVASVARPGGNVTGLFAEQIELASKRLQLMKEMVPGTEKMIVFWDRASAGQWRAAQNTAKRLGLELAGIELRDEPYEYDIALGAAPGNHHSPLVVMSSPVFFNDRKRLTEITLQRGLPAMFFQREFAELGALSSYGPNGVSLLRRLADYVDRIARGAKPADLPIEQPTKFELIVNLKTAKAFSLEVPTSLLLRADEVIE